MATNRRPPTGPRRTAPPPQHHVVDPDRLARSDRRPSAEDLAWLRPMVGGPPPPPPPRRPRTTFDSSPPPPRAARSYEPLPFHPMWVVIALALWAGIWFSLYVASAVLLR